MLSSNVPLIRFSGNFQANINLYLSYGSNLISQLLSIYDVKCLQKNPCCCHHLLILLNINVHKFLYDQEEYGNDDIGSKGI